MTQLLLAIDTAFERCSAAVFDGASGRLLASAEPEIGKGHAEQLMAVIADVLERAGVAYGDLARIGVTVGPGSFTGIRVGVAAARGLALALDIPAVGIDTLSALAAPEFGKGRAVLATLDAKRGEIYAALYDAEGAVVAAPRALAPADLSAMLAGLDADALLGLVGTGSPIAQAALPDRRPELLGSDSRIDMAAFARLAARAAEAPPRPLYLRGADAKPSSAAGTISFRVPASPQAVP
ncbi:MAG: tRNA (adenosine(37)-N6)-threonylcarbamoyltransferase complex dimerization subunit type 1 TsaB [Aurantimonas endophytica]|uniref:tRNA (adenosine(37)-N6)-threonylcarbamoyltransferase complex dimerization subunit type 1 TsaB n=1 Tax=Aurantimonas endophytica TaxID=1522175 RepID=UPI00300199C6